MQSRIESLLGIETFIIAEIGSNHDGNFDKALRLMDTAREAGANAVKFQSFLADHLVTKDSPDYDLLKRLEVPHAWYPALYKEAKDRGLVFFSTATNEITMNWMEEIGVELYKIASPNLTHIPLVKSVARTGKCALLSTGMAGYSEIDEAVNAFKNEGNENFALLHCVSVYPADPSLINLRFLETLRQMYPNPVGYSDHTTGIGVAVAATALGARVIEKHITYDRKAQGPDHHYALEPDEFILMCKSIRTAEQAVGSPQKQISLGEKETSNRAWRSLRAARSLKEGEILLPADIAVVRPADGLHSRYAETLPGLRLQRDMKAGDPFRWDCFKEEEK